MTRSIVCVLGLLLSVNARAENLTSAQRGNLLRQVELLSVMLPFEQGSNNGYWGRTPEGHSCAVFVSRLGGTDFGVVMQQKHESLSFAYGPRTLDSKLFGVPVYTPFSSFKPTAEGLQASVRLQEGYFGSRKTSIRIADIAGNLMSVMVSENGRRMTCLLERGMFCKKKLGNSPFDPTTD